MTDLTVPTETARLEVPSRSLWQDAWLRLRKNKAAVASAIVLLLMAFLGIFGPMLSPHPYDKIYPQFVRVHRASKPIRVKIQSCRALNANLPVRG